MFEVLLKLLQVSFVVIHNRVTCHSMLLVVIAYPFNNYLSVIYMVVSFIFKGSKISPPNPDWSPFEGSTREFQQVF